MGRLPALQTRIYRRELNMKKQIKSLIITFIVCFGLVVLSAFIFCAEGRDLGELILKQL